MFKENNEARKEVNIHKWHEKGFIGKDIHVVVLDSRSGVNKHMTYASAPLVRPDYGTAHGTNVAQCVHEFAPGVKITLIHSAQQGRDWIKENISTIDLVNISMSSLESDSARRSFGFLEEYDIPVLCAAGNYSKNGILDEVRYPANFLWTVAVGAYNWRDKGVKANDVVSYSNGGVNLDCVAPTNIYVMNNVGEMFTFDGTSAATPSATGMLSCYAQYLKDIGSKLTREKAEKFIHQNCKDIKEKGFDYISGHGLFFMPEVPSVVVAPTIPSKPIAVKPIVVPPSPVQQVGEQDEYTEKEIAEKMEQYFKDVGKSSALFEDIQKGVDRGIAKGYSDGTFRPNQQVSRGETITFINRAIEYMLKEIKK